MSGQEAFDLPGLAVRLARAVPETVALGVAAALDARATPLSASARARIVADVAQPANRAAVARFLDGWIACEPDVPPVAVAYAVRTAARAVTMHREEISVELVWTGPNPDATPLRRTDQALLEVIDAARHTLTIVTFAAYHVPAIAAALVRAAARHVRLRIIVESAQASEGKIAYEAIDALGAQVAAMATMYVWPLDQRPVDDRGRHGSLHVKCALADDDMLFVSSANLTAYALTLNMELGLLVRGGRIPRQVAAHLDTLIGRGVVEPLDAVHY